MFVFRSACTFLILLFSLSIASAQSPIPDQDKDLEELHVALEKVVALADQCLLSNYPEMDCTVTQKYYRQVRDVRGYLIRAQYWYDYAFKSQSATLLDAMDDSARVKSAIKAMDLVANGKHYDGLAQRLNDDIAALEGAYDVLREKPQKFYAQRLRSLSMTIIDMMKAEALSSESEFLKSFAEPFSEDDAEEIKKYLGETRQNSWNQFRDGKRWRRTLLKKASRDEIGSHLETLRSAFSKETVESRCSEIDALVGPADSLSETQKADWEQLQRIASRRGQIMRCFDLTTLLLRTNTKTGSGILVNCCVGLNDLCGTLELDHRSRLEFPKVLDFDDAAPPIDLEPNDMSWVKPLGLLKDKLPELAGMLDGMPELSLRDETVTLTVDGEAKVKPEGEITVSFTAKDYFGSKSWIGIVPSDSPHGFEGNNIVNAKGKIQTMTRDREGSFTFKAPKEPGSYDFRMNEHSTGREIASATFEVTGD